MTLPNKTNIEAWREIDSLVERGIGERLIIHKISLKYGFGESFVKKRIKHLQELTIEAKSNSRDLEPELTDEEADLILNAKQEEE